jgi:hypothetical protein
VIHSAKENIYQGVFTDEFHVSFHKSNKGSCDICEGFRSLSNATENNKDKFPVHERKSELGKTERMTDKYLRS